MNIVVKDEIKASMKRFPLCIRLHDGISNWKLRNLIDIMLFPFAYIYQIYLDYFKPQVHGGGYALSVVAIMKNEAPYLKEWIDYHMKVVGVEHFYLYDNDSKDNPFSILKPYIDRGFITYKVIKGTKRQHDAYNDALNTYSDETKYMAFIDIDEFIYCGDKSILDFLDNNLCDKDSVGGIVLNWLLFGSSGHSSKPEGGVLENYIYRAKYDFKENYHVKTICEPTKTLAFVNAHYAVYKHGIHAENISGHEVYGAKSKPVEGVPVIYHYFTKSREEFNAKRLRGKADDWRIRGEAEFDKFDQNEVLDLNLKNLLTKYRSDYDQ